MKEFIEKLIGRLEEKVAEYDVRIQRRNGDCYYDERQNQKKLDERARGIEQAIEIVNQLAEEYNQEKPRKTKKNQEWIPTSERLPEKNAIVLTCDKDGWISVKVNMPYAGVKNDFECGYYTAWMPLPEPFTPKEGRE